MNTIDYTLNTTTNPETGTITHKLETKGQAISTWVMNTREQHVRDALISLGWTPPPVINPEWEKLGPEHDIVWPDDGYRCSNVGPAPVKSRASTPHSADDPLRVEPPKLDLESSNS